MSKDHDTKSHQTGTNYSQLRLNMVELKTGEEKMIYDNCISNLNITQICKIDGETLDNGEMKSKYDGGLPC